MNARSTIALLRTWASSCAMLAALCCAPAAAGPPFRTDDPEPTNYRDWEIYLSGQMENEGATVDGGLPQLELN